MEDPIEWEFSVPASRVDLHRIYQELSCLPAIFAAAYLGELKMHAPVTYAMFAEYAETNNLCCWARL